MARLQARVSLYRAMGGGWTNDRRTTRAADDGTSRCA
jgi:outer membrane protein TolC